MSLLQEITAQTPRLRSAVELLSKPDADILYPAVRFVVNQMSEKYPNMYTSFIKKVSTLFLYHNMNPKRNYFYGG
jgi:hypothetical protein